MLALAGCRWCTGGQDDLAPGTIDVGPQERDALALRRHLDPAEELVEEMGDLLGARRVDKGVGPVEVDEGDRHAPVFGLVHAEEERLPNGGGKAPGQERGGGPRVRAS